MSLQKAIETLKRVTSFSHTDFHTKKESKEKKNVRLSQVSVFFEKTGADERT